MAILSKGNTYSSGDSVTAANLNSLVDSATFVSGSNATTDNTSLEVHSGGYLQVKDDGITNGKIATGAVNADSIAADAVGNSELADNAVQTANIADNAVTPAKISSTDTLLNVNDTRQTIGLGILANASSSSPKVNMDGGVRVGNQAPSVAGELEVTGNGGSNILVVENTSTTATDSSIISCRGPQVTLQLKDTVASTNSGTYNITVDGDYLQINLISDDGLTTTGLLRLRPNGNLSIAGTLSEGGLT